MSNPTQCIVRPDILRWIPDRWDLFLGNYSISRRFKKLVRKVRGMVENKTLVDLNKLCFLLTGESRSGKTAMVKFLIRCIACKEFDDDTLNPCSGTCTTCRQRPELAGLEGLYAEVEAYGPDGRERLPLHFSLIDCTKIYTPDQLRDHLVRLGSVYNGIRVFYLDEVHRLVHRGMDEMLLKTVEEVEAIWFFSTAIPDDLEDMFKNRMLKLATELPTASELGNWLVDRCNEWAIPWQPEAILRVVEKCNRVVGTALHALALASLDDDEGLTLEMVENEWQVK